VNSQKTENWPLTTIPYSLPLKLSTLRQFLIVRPPRSARA
jgi:hypothetical protein